MNIPRLDPPPEGQTVKGWCLYQDDRWDGPAPHDWDEQGWLVYPDRAHAATASWPMLVINHPLISPH